MVFLPLINSKTLQLSHAPRDATNGINSPNPVIDGIVSDYSNECYAMGNTSAKMLLAPARMPPNFSECTKEMDLMKDPNVMVTACQAKITSRQDEEVEENDLIDLETIIPDPQNSFCDIDTMCECGHTGDLVYSVYISPGIALLRQKYEHAFNLSMRQKVPEVAGTTEQSAPFLFDKECPEELKKKLLTILENSRELFCEKMVDLRPSKINKSNWY